MRRLVLPLLLAACASTSFPAVDPGGPGAYVPAARAATWEQRWILDRHGTELVFMSEKTELGGVTLFPERQSVTAIRCE